MKLPISWLERYISIENKAEELADILTKLDSMQDGPLIGNGNDTIINLEIRQNRPDLLSILGLAREYAAYINKPLNYPQIWEDNEIVWQKPSKILDIQAKDIVKRFTAVEIEDIKITQSPDYIINALKLYGIPSINNIVDITNYVMLEYGIPMHAFDTEKLDKTDECYLTLRRAEKNEDFETWQKTKIKLTKEDLVVADATKVVSISGIIGGINSGITDKTKKIILEAANYEHSYIRKSSRKHNLFTDSSLRHEKFLNSNLVETAIRRAIFLIKENSNSEIQIKRIEDFYEEKEKDIIINFNTSEIERLSGLPILADRAKTLLERLEFVILDYKELVETNTSQLDVKVPWHRTDVELEEDLVEEVLRLNGYENIPYQEINLAPPKNITPSILILEDKIRDILIAIGLDEHVTYPLVKYTESTEGTHKQIKLENSLNSEQDGLRNKIYTGLESVSSNYIKNGIQKFGIFEIGEIYYENKIGEYKEERRVGVLYTNQSFDNKVKPDLLYVFNKLNLTESNIGYKIGENYLEYNYLNEKNTPVVIAKLYNDRFELYTSHLIDFVDLQKIPYINIRTGIVQKLVDDLSLIITHDIKLGDLANLINETSEYITNVNYIEEYKSKNKPNDEKIVLIRVTYTDTENKLSRKDTEKIKKEYLDKIKLKLGVKMRG